MNVADSAEAAAGDLNACTLFARVMQVGTCVGEGNRVYFYWRLVVHLYSMIGFRDGRFPEPQVPFFTKTVLPRQGRECRFLPAVFHEFWTAKTSCINLQPARLRTSFAGPIFHNLRASKIRRPDVPKSLRRLSEAPKSVHTSMDAPQSLATMGCEVPCRPVA